MQKRLHDWQNLTSDPWICAPSGVLEDSGRFKSHPVCLELDNGVSIDDGRDGCEEEQGCVPMASRLMNYVLRKLSPYF